MRRRTRLDRLRAYNRRIRHEVFAAYGGARCRCSGGCRISNERWLVIDHVDGARHPRYRGAPRAANNLYHWLRRKGFPPGFRVLCANCNHARQHYGRCAHQDQTRPRRGRDSTKH